MITRTAPRAAPSARSAPPDRGLAMLRTATLFGLMLPGLWLAHGLIQDTLGAKPITEVIHEAGDWAIRLLFLSLAITPFRHIFRWHWLAPLRRRIGVAAFAYAAIHLFFYVVDENFDLAKVASEIVLRIYLTIGFIGLLLLAALAITSTDGMVRRLGGRRWKKLHRAAYVIGLLGTVHFFMQSKLDVSEPTVMAGLFIWLMGWRLIAKLGGNARAASLPALFGLAIAAGMATAFGEAAYYSLKSGIDPSLVLQANLTLMAGLRPAWIVLAIGLSVALLAIVRRGLRALRPAPAAS